MVLVHNTRFEQECVPTGPLKFTRAHPAIQIDSKSAGTVFRTSSGESQNFLVLINKLMRN